ncbi:hypothetical protein ACIP98_31720 [Streptomyces sp. NPDC088354]|uniref:hypothetical protein n=1 Tax=Streptomyces sp. NPDC088354 TaxID=3365856 RepID=UPI0038130EF2
MFFTLSAWAGSDGDAAPDGHRATRVAGPPLGGVLGEGGVSDMVHDIGLPVVAGEFFWLSLTITMYWAPRPRRQSAFPCRIASDGCRLSGAGRSCGMTG